MPAQAQSENPKAGSDPSRKAQLVGAVAQPAFDQRAAPVGHAVGTRKPSQVTHPIVNGVERVRPARPVLDPADRRRQVGEASEAADEDVRAALEKPPLRRKSHGIVGVERRARRFWRTPPNRFEGKPSAADGPSGARSGPDRRRRIDAKFARPSISCVIYAKEARTHFAGADSRFRDRQEKRTEAHFARPRRFRPASRPGIFRFPSSVDKSPARLRREIACLPSPPSRTPLIASAAVRLYLDAGVPGNVLHLLPGDGAPHRQGAVRRSAARGRRLYGFDRDAAIINRASQSATEHCRR